MTQAFTDETFKVDIAGYSGSTTDPVDRTLPDRLSDVVNVKDWGALGDGFTDDTDAIEAAIGFTNTLGKSVNNVCGAMVFFPPGVYIVGKGGTQPLWVSIPAANAGNVTLVGSGRDVTIIRGNYDPGGQQEQENNGFLVQLEVSSFLPADNLHGYTTANAICGMRDLTIHNESTGDTSGACINMGSGNNRYFDNCHFIGVTGFACTERSFGASVRNCLFTCSRPITVASEPAATRSPYFVGSKFLPPSGTPSHGNITGGVGAYLGEGYFYNLHAVGFDIGFSVIGSASIMNGCSATQCGIGITTGIRNGSHSVGSLDAGNVPGDWYFLFSGQITSCKFDRCTLGIHAYQPRALFAANNVTGTTGPNTPAAISGMSYNGGTHVVTVTTTDDHNITSLSTVQISPASLTDDPDGFVTVTTGGGLTTKQFTYSKAATPSFTTGTWNYSLEYGVICDSPGGCSFAANSIDASVSIASFVAGFGAGGNDNVVWCTRGKYGWIPANNSFNPFPDGLWEYDMCGGGGPASLVRPTSAAGTPVRFPGIPNVRNLPGLQNNYPGHPTVGKERTLVTARATTSSFGDVISAFLVTTIDATSGSSVLTFASVPSFINNTAGFAVDNWFGHVGTANNAIASTTGTTVTLGSALTATVPAGSRIYFNRFDGTGTAYKVRYDGEAWRRIA